MDDPSEDPWNPFVLDNGNASVRLGRAGEDVHDVEVQNIVGEPRFPVQMHGLTPPGPFVGSEATKRRGIMRLSYPMEHGVIMDWDRMDSVWKVAFKRASVKPEDRNCVLSETVFSPKKQRLRIVEHFFEEFKVCGLLTGSAAVLELYASGSTTGVCLSLGDGSIAATAVVEGYGLPHATRLNFGGRELTAYLARVRLVCTVKTYGLKLLRERGVALCSSAELEIARDIKERLAWVGYSSYVGGERPIGKRNYLLPDGREISLDSERYRCMEPLFDPALLGIEAMPLDEMVVGQVLAQSCDVHLALLGHITICGKAGACENLVPRLSWEINSRLHRLNSYATVKFDRQYGANACWVGGSILGSLTRPCWGNPFITREEYEEYGASIGFRKCIGNRAVQ